MIYRDIHDDLTNYDSLLISFRRHSSGSLSLFATINFSNVLFVIPTSIEGHYTNTMKYTPFAVSFFNTNIYNAFVLFSYVFALFIRNGLKWIFLSLLTPL